MRILHTSDWHVGVTMRGRSRAEEHRQVLDEIVGVAEKQEADLVIVAGDVFHHAAPGPESEDIVYDALLKLAEDAIADDRRDVSPFKVAGHPPLVEDVLPAQDTWVNTAWIGLDYTAVPNLRIANKLKYELYDNRAGDPRDPSGRPLRATPVLFGLVNKADFNWTLGSLTVQPKFKSEFLRRKIRIHVSCSPK